MASPLQVLTWVEVPAAVEMKILSEDQAVQHLVLVLAVLLAQVVVLPAQVAVLPAQVAVLHDLVQTFLEVALALL